MKLYDIEYKFINSIRHSFVYASSKKEAFIMFMNNIEQVDEDYINHINIDYLCEVTSIIKS